MTLFELAASRSWLQGNLDGLHSRWGRVIRLGDDPRPRIRIDETAREIDGWPVVSIEGDDGRWRRVHSRRPVDEARRWLNDQLGDQAIPRTVCVVGAGVGYIVDEITERSPATRILVFEQEPELAHAMLARRDWRPLIDAGSLMVLTGPDYEGLQDSWRMFDDAAAEPARLIHPVLATARPEATKTALLGLSKAIAGARANAAARRQFAGPYLLNTLRNLPAIVDSGDAGTLDDTAVGYAAIIAAAGPSLDENLRELSELRPNAVLIAVDTALRPLLSAGIDADVTVAVDPGVRNARHLRNLPPTDSLLVAEGSVDSSSFEAFAGRLLFYRVADHAPWPWLNDLGIDVGRLRAWGSVTCTAFDLALRMGCDPIVFVGADMGYTGWRPYCRNTAYEPDWAARVAQGSSLEDVWKECCRSEIELPGVDGRPVPTATHLVAFRDWLVAQSRETGGRTIINASGGGILAGGAIVQRRLKQVSWPHRTRPVFPRPHRRFGHDDIGRLRARLLAAERDPASVSLVPEGTEVAADDLRLALLGGVAGLGLASGLYAELHEAPARPKPSDSDRDAPEKAPIPVILRAAPRWPAEASGRLTDFSALSLRIETTSRCNFRCTFCPHSRLQRPPGTMNVSVFEKLVFDAASLGVAKVELHNFGEPLMDRDLVARVRTARQAGHRDISFHTNGYLLDAPTLDRLATAGVSRVYVTLAPRREFRATRPGVDLEKLWGNIGSLSDSPHRGLITVNYTRSGLSTKAEDAEFVTWLAENGLALNEAGTLHEWALGPMGEAYPCHRLWTTATVLWTGQMALCCLDFEGEYDFGSVADLGLEAVLNGGAYTRVRADHLTGNFVPKCARCDMPRQRDYRAHSTS